VIALQLASGASSSFSDTHSLSSDELCLCKMELYEANCTVTDLNHQLHLRKRKCCPTKCTPAAETAELTATIEIQLEEIKNKDAILEVFRRQAAENSKRTSASSEGPAPLREAKTVALLQLHQAAKLSTTAQTNFSTRLPHLEDHFSRQTKLINETVRRVQAANSRSEIVRTLSAHVQVQAATDLGLYKHTAAEEARLSRTIKSEAREILVYKRKEREQKLKAAALETLRKKDTLRLKEKLEVAKKKIVLVEQRAVRIGDVSHISLANTTVAEEFRLGGNGNGDSGDDGEQYFDSEGRPVPDPQSCDEDLHSEGGTLHSDEQKSESEGHSDRSERRSTFARTSSVGGVICPHGRASNYCVICAKVVSTLVAKTSVADITAAAEKQGHQLTFAEKRKRRSKHKASIKASKEELFRERSFIGRKSDSDSDVSSPPGSPGVQLTVSDSEATAALPGSASEPIVLATKTKRASKSTASNKSSKKFKRGSSSAPALKRKKRGAAITDLTEEHCPLCVLGSGKLLGHVGAHLRNAPTQN
jgi:hypothetical protein